MTDIKPTYVTFEQAKLLKEKGFENIQIDYGLNQMLNNAKPPEQWQVIEWASLVHNIDIEARVVGYAGDIKTSYYQPYINGCIINISKFSTRQQAYSAAFDYFLNNLI
jgi:hypothetical protein